MLISNKVNKCCKKLEIRKVKIYVATDAREQSTFGPSHPKAYVALMYY